MKADRLIGISLILATGLLWALYAVNAESPVRLALALVYLFVAPGLAVMSLLDLAQRWATAVLSIALSLGIGTVVATALLLAHLWTPDRALGIVGCITLLAAGAKLVIPSGSPGPVVSTQPGMERRDGGS
jgi:hypothetical protein